MPLLKFTVLAAAMFVTMTAEFLPGGLIPTIAKDLNQSVAAIGQLISVFAATVVLTAAPVTALSVSLPRKPLMLAALLLVSAANVTAAAAPSFEMVLTARVAAGLGHGVFWSVAAAYASYLVPAHQLGRAIAITSGGGSLAGIVGVPIGNALGQFFGWRVAFLTIGIIGVVIALIALLTLPAAGPTPSPRPRQNRTRTRTPRDATPRVLLLSGMLLIVILGPTLFTTYMVAWLEDIAAFPANAVPILLLGGGIAGAVGLAFGGAFGDRFPGATLGVAGATCVLGLTAYAVLGGSSGLAPILVVVLVSGVAFGPIPMLLQTRIMKASTPETRSFAAALQTTAINIGIGGGAAIGGLLLDANGLHSLPATAAAVMGAGVAMLLWIELRRPHN